jgi:hypothetical protein
MPLEQAYTVLYDSSDTEVGTASNPLRIDPTGTTTQPVSGTVTANQGTAAAVASAWPILVTDGVDTAEVVNTTPGAGAYGLVVRVAGSISTTTTRPATSTVTSVNVTTANTTLQASNANRLGLTIWNDGGQRIFVKLGATASTTSFTVKVANQSFYALMDPVYTGIVDAVTSTGTATVLVTELTP